MSKRSFRQNFISLMSGTALAQVLALIFIPVLSRLYSPESFGLFAVYFATSSLLGVLLSWRMELAIVLAKEEDDAKHIVWLCCIIASLSIFFVSCIGGLFSYFYSLPWLPTALIPITLASAFLASLIQILVNWHTRKQNFPTLAFRNVTERALILIAGIAFGFYQWSEAGLIYSQVLGYSFSVFYLLGKGRLTRTKTAFLWRPLFTKYVDLPKRNLFATFLSSSSNYIMSFLFGSYYPKADLGQFNMVSRIFESPVTLLANTFHDVYFQTTSTLDDQDRRKLFNKSLKVLTLLAAPPLFIICLLAPQIFEIVLGPSWKEAGQMAQWLAPLTLFRMIFVSQMSLLIVQRRLDVHLTISLLLFAAQVLSFLIGHFVFESLYACVVLMAVTGCLAYSLAIFLIHWTLPRSKR